MELFINDYWELLALHKSLMAAKFDPDPYIRELQGSPFTGSLAFKVFDLLVEACKAEGKTKLAEDWLEWQHADESRVETQLLLKRIEEGPWWSDADDIERRQKCITDFMAPLKLDSKLQNKIAKKNLKT